MYILIVRMLAKKVYKLAKRWLGIFIILMISIGVVYFFTKFDVFNRTKDEATYVAKQEAHIREVFNEKWTDTKDVYANLPIKVLDRNGDEITISDKEEQPVVEIVKQWAKLHFTFDYESSTVANLQAEEKLFTVEKQQLVTETSNNTVLANLKKAKFRSYLETFNIESIQFTLYHDKPVYKVIVNVDAYQANNGVVGTINYKVALLIEQQSKKIEGAGILQSNAK